MPLIDAQLLEIMECIANTPEGVRCKGKLSEDEAASRLVCERCGTRYPVRDGIPVMLIDEAELGPDARKPQA